MQLSHNGNMNKRKLSYAGQRLDELTPDMSDPQRVRHWMRIARVGQGTVSRWNTGESPIGPTSSKRIAKHHEINAEWLRERDAEKYIARDDDPHMQRIRSAMNFLDEQDKEELSVLAELKARRYGP